MKKSKKINMHKLYCLCNLLIENLEDLEVTKPKIVKFKTDLIGFCEELNNEVADTYTIQKSTYFHEITAKIDTIMRKNFNHEM